MAYIMIYFLCGNLHIFNNVTSMSLYETCIYNSLGVEFEPDFSAACQSGNPLYSLKYNIQFISLDNNNLLFLKTIKMS